MKQLESTLVLLPGLGADPRLFDPQRSEFPNLISPPWLEPTSNESLAGYAARMAERIRPMLPTDGRSLVLGGVSFGGMLAAEMAPLLKPDALVLIGSALSPKEIAPSLRLMAMAGRWMPAPRGESAKFMARGFIRQLGPMKREHRLFLETMIDAVPFSFLQWAGRAIFGWEGASHTHRNLIRVHGERDRIIPCRPCGASSAHVVIPNAGHVPNVSHAEVINKTLADCVRTLEKQS